MKIQILILGIIAALSFLSFFEASHAKSPKSKKSEENSVVEEFKASAKYNSDDLLNILANLEKDIRHDDKKSFRSMSAALTDYLDYRKSEVAKHDDKYSKATSAFNGERVLELKYGNWLKSKELILPLSIEGSPLVASVIKNNEVLSGFKRNEIKSIKVRYVSYDVGNKKAGNDLHALLSNVESGDLEKANENIKNIYSDILIDHDDKISLVSKIRDNLAVAKYLLDHNQAHAAQNSVNAIDSLSLRLLELKSNSPAEQQRIKQLRKELNHVSKVADANYVSEWEKIPTEIEDWWTKK